MLLVLAGASAGSTLSQATSRRPTEDDAAQAAPALADGRHVVTIGYQGGAPFGMQDPKTRASRLIDQAFPAERYERRFRQFHRSELRSAIQAGLADVGVVMVRAALTTEGELPDDALLPTNGAREVQTLLVHPSGYSVVTSPRQLGWSEELSRASMILIPLGAVAGVLALALCALLLNLRWPALSYARNGGRRGELVIGSFNRLDPQLVALSRTAHWLLQTKRGLLMAALWAALGACLTLLVIHGAAPIHEMPPSSPTHLLEGAMRAAYPGAELQELRGEWSRCARPIDCLTNYRDEKVTAIAGDRDVVCHYARLSQMAVEFEPGIAVPLQYALLLPDPSSAGSTTAQSRRAMLRAALVDALQHVPPPTSPWASCGFGSSYSNAR